MNDPIELCGWCEAEEVRSKMAVATAQELAGALLCPRCQEKERRFVAMPPLG